MPEAVIDVDEASGRLSRRFGPQVATWCTGLPALAAELAARWGLRLGPAWPRGGTSVVLPCESASGQPLVLKLTPDQRIAADEAVALTAWSGGRHVVRLRDADPGRGALLLERVLPGIRLADEPDQWPLAEIAPVMAELWREPSGAGGAGVAGMAGGARGVEGATGVNGAGGLGGTAGVGGLPGLRERAEFVFAITRERIERHPGVARALPPGLVERSEGQARELAGAGPKRLLHGDLHAGNVLRGGRGLVAIDPRPCLGDPASDAVDWVLADAASEQAVRQRIDRLAGRVDGLDPDRAWAWGQAMAVVIAVVLLIRGDDQGGANMLALAATLR